MQYRIKEILKIKGINISDFALSIGMKRETLSRIINGSSTTVDTLEKIAKELDVEVWELFTPELTKKELIALINHKGDNYKAHTLEELEEIVQKIKENI